MKKQIRVTSLSGCVPKILALHRMTKIDFPPEFRIHLMHTFPMMYGTMGLKVDGLTVKDNFLPNKLGDAISISDLKLSMTNPLTH